MIRLPYTLTAKGREFLHCMCNKWGLKSKSYGNEQFDDADPLVAKQIQSLLKSPFSDCSVIAHPSVIHRRHFRLSTIGFCNPCRGISPPPCPALPRIWRRL